MIDDSSTLPMTIAAGGRGRVSTVAQLADIPEEEIGLEISFLWRPMLRDADDEMVLKVAVNGRVDRLLTCNERDFAGAGGLGIVVERPGPAWRSWRRG
jgi:gamma-glutamyl phosphate reductase